MRRALPWAAALALWACDDGGGGGVAPAGDGAVDAAADAAVRPGVDSDGDGLTDAEERAGWRILIDFSGFGLRDPAYLIARQVSSDPMRADTDGDGLSDFEEFERNCDPTVRDTDGDGLSDAEEVRRWRTSPASVDSDADSRGADPANPIPPSSELFDGAELALQPDPRDPDGPWVPGPGATSPTLADTDGDGLDDAAERRAPLRDPVVAELPQVRLQVVDELDLRLRLTFADARREAVTVGASLSRAETARLSVTDTEGQRHTRENAVTMGVQAKLGIPSSVTLSVSVTNTDGVVESTGRAVSAGEAQALREAHREGVSASTTAVVSTVGGVMTASVQAQNPGAQAWQLEGLGVTVRAYDPRTRRYRSVATLTPPPGFDAFAVGPGEASPVIPLQGQADAGLLRRFMGNPTALELAPAQYTLTGADGAPLAFAQQQAFQQTALIVVDRGDGRPERWRVATDVDRTLDGRPAGLRLVDALAARGLAPETARDDQGREVLVALDGLAQARHPDQPAPALDDPLGPDDPDPGPRDAARLWAVLGHRPLGAFPTELGVGDVRLVGGDTVTVLYVSDLDRDGAWDRAEVAAGARPDQVHSDAAADRPVGDGLSDYFETVVGWTVDVNGPEAPAPYRVLPSPALVDTDGDGWDDAQEHAQGTDPTLADTDLDGLPDPEDPAPLAFVNTPPVIALQPQTTLDEVRLLGRISDPEGNLALVQVDWGDGSEPTVLYADEQPPEAFEALDVRHTYGATDQFRLQVLAVDAYGAEATAVVDLDSVAFPIDPVLHDRFDRDLSETLCTWEDGEDRDRADRRGPGGPNNPRWACELYQSEFDAPLTLHYPGLTVAREATLAAWLRHDRIGANEGFIFGQVGYPALAFDSEAGAIGLVVKTGFDPRQDRVAVTGPRTAFGEWVFYVATLRVDPDTFTTRLALYVDGELAAERAVPNWFSRRLPDCGGVSLGGAFFQAGELGACGMAGGDRFTGAVDDLRLFDRALRPAEIRALAMEP